ncbi:hypothetical protein MASR2M47_25980 [Draconibacterium sp.]|jgi:hypothetical protein
MTYRKNDIIHYRLEKSEISFKEAKSLANNGFWNGTANRLYYRQAKAGQTIYYSDLANQIGIPNPRNLNYLVKYLLGIEVIDKIKMSQ